VRKILIMKNLFEKNTVDEIKERILQLTKNHKPLWGAMTAAQMMAHCSKALENALGESYYSNTLVLRIWAWWNKSSNRDRYTNDTPFPSNPAHIYNKSKLVQQGRLDNPFRVTDSRNFDKEKTILLQWIIRFRREGKDKCIQAKHPSFGKFTPEEWAIGQYKHLDYHLRQFGV